MHYVFTKILRYSYAALDCASMKANILHVQKCSDRLPSLSISGASADLVAFAMALFVMAEVTVCGQLTKAELINGITLLKAGNDAKAQYNTNNLGFLPSSKTWKLYTNTHDRKQQRNATVEERQGDMNDKLNVVHKQYRIVVFHIEIQLEPADHSL
ncbi:hypothetical protein T07_10550, partial [Trichinella nelsoni]